MTNLVLTFEDIDEDTELELIEDSVNIEPIKTDIKHGIMTNDVIVTCQFKCQLKSKCKLSEETI